MTAAETDRRCSDCGTALGELNSDASGDVLCLRCYAKRPGPTLSEAEVREPEIREPSPAGDAPHPTDLTARLAACRVDLVTYRAPAEPQCLPTLERMVPVGARVECAAEAKTGKSLAWLVTAADIVIEGGTVVILDRENGAAEYARRLSDIMAARDCDAAERQALSERLHYHGWPVLTLEDRATIATTLCGADLVIFDSSRAHLSALSLEENSSDDFARFTTAMLDPLAQAGIASVLLDNVGHDERGRPRGSSSKVDLVDVVLILERVAPFDRKRRGRLRMRVTHARSGSLDGTWHMDMGGGTFGSWEAEDADGARARKVTEARERFRQVCVEVLTASGTLGRDLLIEACRERDVSGRNKTLRAWLAELAVDPTSGIEHTAEGYSCPGPDGPGRGTGAYPGPDAAGRGSDEATEPPESERGNAPAPMVRAGVGPGHRGHPGPPDPGPLNTGPGQGRLPTSSPRNAIFDHGEEDA